MLDSKQIWQTALDHLQLAMTRGNYETWLKDTWAVDFDGATFVVGVENPFAKEWLEGRFAGMIRKTLSDLLGQPTQVRFISQRRAASLRQAEPLPLQSVALDERPAPPAAPPRPLVVGSPLNPRYTFETFVVGNSNRLAHAASRAVADRPGHAYNPLFIYGGVGLGKTHLLHAIGHAVARQGLTAVYVSSETFTNELIDSIRRQQMEEFRQKYRGTPLLLIDDIQFIAGKERTEEEFFHTFNAIHEAGGQVVLSSDRPPKAMTVLQERLQSRFAMGLIADVQPPDFETRLAILRSKTNNGQVVPSEVLEYVARRIQSNIRELEGSLTRIVAYGQLHERPVTVELAAAALKDVLLDGARPMIHPESIVRAVSQYYGVTPEDLRGKARDKKIVTPRQVAMFLLREDAKLSLPDIGALLGGRDHTTVLHGCRAIQNELDREGPVVNNIKGIRQSYRAPDSP